MTTAELIHQLSQCQPDSLVTLWVNGERYEVDSMDDSFEQDHEFVELNASTTDEA